MVRRPMLLFLIVGSVPWILLLSLAGLLYLTWLDLREEPAEPIVKVWWGLLVLLTNVVGYAALRIWLAVRRRRAAAHRSA
jgi:membrane protein DedA with SNARE-associated domain